MRVGYARVSTHEQNLEAQLDALQRVGCDKIKMAIKSIMLWKISSSKHKINAIKIGDLNLRIFVYPLKLYISVKITDFSFG